MGELNGMFLPWWALRRQWRQVEGFAREDQSRRAKDPAKNHVYGAKDHPRIIQGSSSCPNMEKTAGRRRAMWGHKNFTQLLKLLGPFGVVHTLEILFDHFPRFFMFFSIFHDFWWFLMIVFPTSKHCFRSHGVFLRAADLGSMAAQVPAGGEAKPHGQGDFVFRASDFSADLMIGKNQQNCRFHILRWFPKSFSISSRF